MRRAAAALLGTLLLTATLTACTQPDDTRESPAAGSAPDGTASSAPGVAEEAPDAVRIDVTFDGDAVEPSGERVQVDRGQEVDLVVTADEPGEIHVHSSPEQELEYEGGDQPQTFTMTFDRPGIVEVESHTLDQQIVSLEVG